MDVPSFVDLDPTGHPEPPAAAETHLSIVLFAGGRAYKLYKPVDFGFVDASTRELRRALCHREVEINRRFSPDAYLGVMDLVGEDGRIHDHAVVMRRLPSSRRLSRLVSGSEAGTAVREVARRVAAIHAAAPQPAEAAAAATADAVRTNWEDNFAAMAPSVGTILPQAEFDGVQRLARGFLDGRSALFDRRIEGGFVIDGHGDLLAEDIFCLPDGPRILDCLAFSDRLRHGDVLADIAFLAMDLERLASTELSQQFVQWYREFSGENHPGSLAHHYVAYRAHVRAKVACLRAAQGDETAAEAARVYHRMAAQHLERSRIRLIVVGGAPGTGKSTVALELGQLAGWTVLRSDEMRKELAGMASADRVDAGLDQGMYQPDAVDRVYEALLERGARLLALGETVVLDASWIDCRWREAARRLAAAAHAEPIELRCDAPVEVVVDRITDRRRDGRDASDATVEVARRLRERLDPWPEATVIETTGPVERSVERAVEATR